MELVLVLGVVLLAMAASIAAKQAPVGLVRRRFMALVAVILLIGSYKSLGIWVSVFGSILIALAIRFVEKHTADGSSDENTK